MLQFSTGTVKHAKALSHIFQIGNMVASNNFIENHQYFLVRSVKKRQCGCCVELRVIFENLRLKLYCCVLHAGCLLLTARSRANNIPNKIGAQVTSCRRGHGPRGDCQCIASQSNQFTHLYTVSKDIKYRGHNTCLSVLLEVITNKQYLGNSIGGQLTK